MLQGMHWRILEPRGFAAIAPGGQFFCPCHVADEFAAHLMIGLLQRQCLVEHKPARASEAAHVPLLLAEVHI